MRKKILAAIFLLALFLRFWNLGSYPEAIDEDEMALGYYGYSLFKNGTDEYGNKFPIYFESVGDYKYGLYSYLAAIPVGIFGLNATTTRSVAALAGALSVIVVYYLAKEIFDKEKYALASAFVLAVAPTHIHFSRVAYSNVLGAFFGTISILFFLRYLKKESLKKLLITTLFFILSIFTYQAYRVFLPASFLLLSAIYFGRLKKERRIRVGGIVLGAIAIVGFSFVPPESRARSQELSHLLNLPKIQEQHTEDSLAGTSVFESRAFHNKVTAFTLGFSERYLSYFDPVFLFARTSTSAGRHVTPDVGIFYLVEALFFGLGLLYLFKHVGKREGLIPISLLLASPLAASFVVEPRSATRAIIIVYAYTLLIGLGIYQFLNFKSLKKVALYIAGALYLANFAYFSHQYLVHKVYHHPWYSDVGLKEMVGFVNENKGGYEAVVMSGGHYMPYLFYNKIPPQEFYKNAEFAERALDRGVKVERFGKLRFNMPFECPPAGKEVTLYVCFGYKVPQKAKLLDVIRFRDEQPALFFVDFGEERVKELPERMEYSEDIDKRFEDGVIPADYEAFWPVN